MGHPIFFSVAGADAHFADRIAKRYAKDLIYSYPSTGVEGVDFWAEIERDELPYARGFVIFWSRQFLSSSGTRRELQLASQLFRSGQIRHALLIRLDDTPLFPDQATDEERAVYEWLKPFTERTRASAPFIDEASAAAQVDRLVREQAVIGLPTYPRPFVIEALADAARIDHYTFHPAIWVGGLNGNGRRTTIREFFKQVDGNASAVEVDITEAALPQQMLLRLESEAFSASTERLAALARDDATNDPTAVARVVERIADQGRYVILRQTRIYEDRAVPPEWVTRMIKSLTPRQRPQLFIIAQVRCPDEVQVECGDRLGAFSLTPLKESEAADFARLMIRALDRNPSRWTEEEIAKIAGETGGNPELISAVMRIIAQLNDRDMLTGVIGRETGRFADTMTSLIDWAYRSISHHFEEPRALLFLNDVGATTADDIALFLDTKRPVSSVIANLSSVGLIEGDELDLYRLPPLLSNRLSRYLVDAGLSRWHSEAMKRYVGQPVDLGSEEHGYVRIETKIAASLWVGDKVPDPIKAFVTAAHYLQAGIRAYNARKREVAFNNLKKAFDQRASFGMTARLEVARYFGLAAAQMKRSAEVDAALAVLGSHYLGKPMALYLRGFAAERRSNLPEAIDYYRRALQAARDDRQTTREAQTIRPLVNCILRSRSPNLREAVTLSERAVAINHSFFSLMMRAKALLHLHFKGDFPDQEAIDQSYDAYEVALRELEDHPRDGEQGYAQIRAEESAFIGDYADAAAWMKTAIDHTDRVDLWSKRWRYLTLSGTAEHAKVVSSEIDEMVRNARYRDEIASFRETVAERYAFALKIKGELYKARLDQMFPQFSGKINLEILDKVRRWRHKDFEGDF